MIVIVIARSIRSIVLVLVLLVYYTNSSSSYVEK